MLVHSPTSKFFQGLPVVAPWFTLISLNERTLIICILLLLSFQALTFSLVSRECSHLAGPSPHHFFKAIITKPESLSLLNLLLLPNYPIFLVRSITVRIPPLFCLSSWKLMHRFTQSLLVVHTQWKVSIEMTITTTLRRCLLKYFFRHCRSFASIRSLY